MLKFLRLELDEDKRAAWEAQSGHKWHQYLTALLDAVDKSVEDHHTVDRQMFHTTNFLDSIDTVFVDLWSEEEDLVGLQGNPEYLQRLREYAERCCAKAAETFLLDNQQDVGEAGTVYRQLRSKILLSSARTAESAIVPLPLFMKSLAEVINNELMKYQEAIKEVSMII